MQGARVARREMDLLHGPIFSKIMAFVIPLMLTNMLQSLYNAADMIIVGLSGVSGALGAIGTTGAMVALVINLFAGFAIGANIMVARAIGEGNREKASSHRRSDAGFSFLQSGCPCWR